MTRQNGLAKTIRCPSIFQIIKKEGTDMPTIMEAIATNSSLKTLASAVNAADMAEILNNPGPFTLFAPNDEAFEKLNAETILADREKILSILQYHLVAEKHLANTLDAKNIFSLLTEKGKSLSVYLDENEVMIDNAHIVEPDILCSNGVIHIIDNVFLPQHSGWYETLA
jgi:uncharacterized surface protein with fasciclin (FAS1) repeats